MLMLKLFNLIFTFYANCAIIQVLKHKDKEIYIEGESWIRKIKELVYLNI